MRDLKRIVSGKVGTGRAIAQAVSRQLPIATVRIRP
jgi:hypothetical protein